MEMFRLRLNCFVYALLMMLILLLGRRASIAQAQAFVAGKKLEFASSVDYERVSALTHEEKTYDEFLTGVKERNQKLRGRKILSSKGEEKELKGEVSSCARTTTRSSIGQEEKGSLNEKCKSLSKKEDQDVESSRTGFEALNSDYYLPRHHPPKNN